MAEYPRGKDYSLQKGILEFHSIMSAKINAIVIIFAPDDGKKASSHLRPAAPAIANRAQGLNQDN